MIKVQAEAFDVAAELKQAKTGKLDIGGTAVFVGSVRDLNEQHGVSSLTLEHYPGMTEAELSEIEAEAHRRWTLHATTIVHRYGRMEPGEDIVLVIACAAHRGDAFAACEFVMDWLKTKAPFWKLEERDNGKAWVASRDSDETAALRWDKTDP